MKYSYILSNLSDSIKILQAVVAGGSIIDAFKKDFALNQKLVLRDADMQKKIEDQRLDLWISWMERSLYEPEVLRAHLNTLAGEALQLLTQSTYVYESLGDEYMDACIANVYYSPEELEAMRKDVSELERMISLS